MTKGNVFAGVSYAEVAPCAAAFLLRRMFCRRLPEGHARGALTSGNAYLLIKRLLLVAAIMAECVVYGGEKGERSVAHACPLKVLAVGNSFSYSLMAQLPACARALPGADRDFATLVIGGCTLERHWGCLVKSCDPEFRPYEVYWSFASAPEKSNPPFGEAIKDGKANIRQMLQAVKWDIVTVQQASHASWDEKTYQPYADNLIAKIEELDEETVNNIAHRAHGPERRLLRLRGRQRRSSQRGAPAKRTYRHHRNGRRRRSALRPR